MKKLYKFEWDCGRDGSVEGLFIEDTDLVKNSLGNQVRFGEILGKHSDIYGDLEEGDLTEIEIPQELLEILENKCSSNISGYNPLNYISYTCSVCDNSYMVGEVEWKHIDDTHICEFCCDNTEAE